MRSSAAARCVTGAEVGGAWRMGMAGRCYAAGCAVELELAITKTAATCGTIALP